MFLRNTILIPSLPVSDKRLFPLFLLILVFFLDGCKESANKEGAKGEIVSLKKGYVSEKPQVLVDSSGKQTPLKWEVDGKTIAFKTQIYEGESTEVYIINGQREDWLHSCSHGGRVELMVRPDANPDIGEILHILCISEGEPPTTKGVRTYVDKRPTYYEDKEFKDFQMRTMGPYEKKGVYYEPLKKHADALYLQTLSAGDNQSCGIRKDGTAICWGKPGRETAAPEGEHFTMVDVNVLLSCGIKTDQSIRCWGDGPNIGGDRIDPPKGRFVDIAVGHSQMCAINTEGKSSCWWTDPPKKRRKDTTADRVIALAIEQGNIEMPEGEFTNIEAEYLITCGLLKDGAIKCWGSNSDGLISKIPAGAFTQLALGASSACALRADGSVACWGALADDYGPPPTGPFTQVAVGSSAACAVGSGGKVQCWGSDEAKQLEAPAGSFRFVSVGGRFACAIRTDDTVACWGTAGRSVNSIMTTLPLF